MLIDTHAHLFWESYDQDRDEVLQRAVDAEVTTIINVGVNVELSHKAIELTNQDNSGISVYSSIAIHPEEAIKYYSTQPAEISRLIKEAIQKLEAIYQNNPQKVVAVGECGLDYAYFTHQGYLPEGVSVEVAKELQRQLFRAQIELAKKLNLPLLLHIRDDRSDNPELIECWNEALEMTHDHFGILHCYSGLMTTTQKVLKSNFLVSFAGNLTYKKNEYLREAVQFLPLEKIVLETDCPFLPPQSIRGKRNEPSSVKEIAELIAQLKEVSFEEVAKVTTQNAKQILKLD